MRAEVCAESCSWPELRQINIFFAGKLAHLVRGADRDVLIGRCGLQQRVQRIKPQCLGFKDAAQVARYLLGKFVERGQFAIATEKALCHLVLERRYGFVRYAARDNQLEEVKIRTH